MSILSIIIPTFNAAGTIRTLTEQLEKQLADYDFMILFVDDDSRDSTRDVILAVTKEYPNIRYFFAPENKGQQESLRTGLNLISEPCDYVITMDDDLQNPVRMIPLLLNKIKSGYDLVYAVPEIDRADGSRAPSMTRRLGSLFRDQLFNSFSNKPPEVKVSAFRILTCDLAKKIAVSKRKFFYLSAEAFQYPIRAAHISYEYVPRASGRSSYHFGKLLILYFRILLYYKLKLF